MQPYPTNRLGWLLRHAVVSKQSNHFCSRSLFGKVSLWEASDMTSFHGFLALIRHLQHLPQLLAAPWAEAKGKQGTAWGSRAGCEMADA